MVGQGGGQRRSGTFRRFARWSAAAVGLAVVVTGAGGPSPGLPSAGAGLVLVAVGLAVGMSVVAAHLRTASVGLLVRRLRRRPYADLTGSFALLASPTTTGGRSAVDDALSTVLVDGRHLVVVLEVRPSADQDDPLPMTYVHALSPLLDAGGIRVAEIRGVHSPGTRTSAMGSRPRTLVVVRIDVVVNGSAIRARGGDERGARRVVAVTAARAVTLLRPLGTRPRLLDMDAALRAHAELSAPPTTHDRQLPAARASAPDHEGRREMRRNDRWYRLLRIDGTTASPGPAAPTTRSSSPLPADPTDPAHAIARLARAAEQGAPPGAVMITSWIRAGPGGMRTGGSVRLAADTVPGLDQLERTLRGCLGEAADTLRVTVDEQQVVFVAGLPLGGPGTWAPGRL